MPLHHPPGDDHERVRCNAAGQVVLTLKTPWRDGTMQLAMSPLDFTQPLASPVPTGGGPAPELFARCPHERRKRPAKSS